MRRCRLPSLPRHLHIIRSGDMLVLLLTLTIAVFFINGFQLVSLNDSSPSDAELRPFKLWNPLTLWIAEKVLLHAWSVTLMVLFLAKVVSRFWNNDSVDAVVLCASLGVAGLFQLCQMFAHTGHLLPFACLIIFYFYTGFPLWILRLVSIGTTIVCCLIDMALRPCAAPLLAVRLMLSLLLCLAGRAAYQCTVLLGVQVCESREPDYCAKFLDRRRPSVSVSSEASSVSSLESLSLGSEWNNAEGRSECSEEFSGDEDSSIQTLDEGMNSQTDLTDSSDCESTAAEAARRFAAHAGSAREVVVKPGEVFAEGWEGLCSIKHRALRNRQYLRTEEVFQDFTSINEEHRRTWPQRDRSSLAVVRNTGPSSDSTRLPFPLFGCGGCFPSKSACAGNRDGDSPSLSHWGMFPNSHSPASEPDVIWGQGSSSTVTQLATLYAGALASAESPRAGAGTPVGGPTWPEAGGVREAKQRLHEVRALCGPARGRRASECSVVDSAVKNSGDVQSGHGASPRARFSDATHRTRCSADVLVTSVDNLALEALVDLKENKGSDGEGGDVASDLSLKSETLVRAPGNARNKSVLRDGPAGLSIEKDGASEDLGLQTSAELETANEATRMKRNMEVFVGDPIVGAEKPVLKRRKTVMEIRRQGSGCTVAASEIRNARRHSAPVKSWSFQATVMEVSDKHSVHRCDHRRDLFKRVKTSYFYWQLLELKCTLECASWLQAVRVVDLAARGLVLRTAVPTPAMSPLGVFKDGTIEEWYLIWRADNVSSFYKMTMKTNLFLNLVNTIFVSLVMFASEPLAIAKEEGFSTAGRILTVFTGVVRQEGGWVCLRSVAQFVIVTGLVLPMGIITRRKGKNAWRFHLLACGLAFTHLAFLLLDTYKVIHMAARRSASGAVLRVDSGSQSFALIPLLMIALQLQVRGPIASAVLVVAVCSHSLVAVFFISQADSPTNAVLFIFLELSVYAGFLVVVVLAFEFNRRRMFCAYILPSLLYLSTLSTEKAGRLTSSEKRL
ncbi:hypothetical protein CSUI_010806 [Cystoisospora suis]|uniref:Transmembrane protein n=1 Tax=Cystoisospora suis TaxID=483139 RepID=A0A2C6KG77_9APIC|nr:hypothetical protein CSUI_010806 [Cystoisospora suis]